MKLHVSLKNMAIKVCFVVNKSKRKGSTAQEGADTKQGAGITANGEVPNYGTNNNQNGKIVYDNKTVTKSKTMK